MVIVKFATVAALALVSLPALAQPKTFDDSVTGSLQNRAETSLTSPVGTVVVVSPVERRVDGVREVLIRNNWMIAPND